MPQDACILKRGAVDNVLDLANYGLMWAKFAGLTDGFAKKRGAIFDHRILQYLDFADLSQLYKLTTVGLFV